MSKRIDNFCKDCNNRILKTGKVRPQRCGPCYWAYLRSLKGSDNPNYNSGLRICGQCGEAKTPRSNRCICKKCYDTNMAALNRCKKCGGKRARKTSEYCQKCYKGDVTKRWNPELTDEFRVKGRTINPEYYIWRIEVFERDEYTCQKCGDNRGGNLTAHHLYSFKDYPILRTIVSNGITLCEDCHREFHGEFSYFHNTKEQMDLFMQNKIYGKGQIMG